MLCSVVMAYWRLFYHFVWSTKLRRPLIVEAIEASLHNVIAAKAKEVGGMVHAVGGIEDHVHSANITGITRCCRRSRSRSDAMQIKKAGKLIPAFTSCQS
jgi:REP element-mobilizing transposase RayT